MLGGPMRTLLCAAAAVVMAWELVLMPFAGVAAIRNHAWGSWLALALALLALAAVFALHVAGAVKFRIPVWYAFLFPAGYSIGAVMAVDSLRRRFTRRVPWKGRIYR
jgi:chlorobactene glucosyltransferase